MRKKLTQEYLKECLTYDPETGIFTWNIRPESHFKTKIGYNVFKNQFSGKKAGNIDIISGYYKIKISEKSYQAHRLAFLYVEGYIPENQVDHIDRDRLNNKWHNLREVSNQCNQQNCNLQVNNKSGVCGVSWSGTCKKWKSSIGIDIKKNKRDIHLGYFDKFEDAVMARYFEELNNQNWTCSIESSAYKYLMKNNLLKVFHTMDFKKNGLSSKNKSGVTGVSWDKKRNKFVSQIVILKKSIHLGRFDKFEDAVMARYKEEINNPNWKFQETSSAYRYLKDRNLI